MKRMKRILFNLLPIFLWLGNCMIARGDPPLSCCNVIQLGASQVEDCSAKGAFEPVVVTSLETAAVTLQFDTTLAGTPVVVQALDGGTVGINGSSAIDQDGNLSFSFQIGNQAGIYRVSVVANYGNEDIPVSLVQFQVPNPEQ
jgi:hypothetical protein